MAGLRRVLAPLTVILFTCSAVAALQEQRIADPSVDLDRFVNGERLAPGRERPPGARARRWHPAVPHQRSLQWMLTLKGTPSEQRLRDAVARLAQRIATRVSTAGKSD